MAKVTVKVRTASSKKRARGPFSQWKRKWKRKWNQFKKKDGAVVEGALGLGLALLVIALLSVPALRGSNPGNSYGIDVSSHNGEIRWDEVAENGVAFAVIRVGVRGYADGVIKEDTQFKRNMRHAWFHHVDRGVYFYSQAISEEEAVEEATCVLQAVNGANLALPIFLDLEDTNTGGRGRGDGLTREERTDVALAFAEVIREKGYQPGIYANRWYLTSELDTERLRNAGVAIWLAEYTSAAQPKYLEPHDYWQYSRRGSVPGIDGEVDLDRLAVVS